MPGLSGLALIIVSLFILSCNNSKTTTRNANISSGDTSYKTPVVSDQIKGILRSKSGDTLFYIFYNSVNTMEIKLKSETAKLKRELTASGIKYSNADYIYTEWHGASILSKNGIKIFEGMQNNQ